MKLRRILKLSLNLLLHSKLRSVLTIIGIIIGVAAVVSIISIGDGLQQSVQSQLRGLGQDLISISAGASRAGGGFRGGGDLGGGGGRGSTTNVKSLSIRDVQALKLVPGIKAINGVVEGKADIYYNGEKASLNVQGGDPKVFKNFLTTDILSGRFLSQGDINSVVIGYNVANTLFKEPLLIGNILSINNQPYRVVGIFAQASGFGGSDNALITSERDARTILGSTLTLKSDEYSAISVQVNDANAITDITNSVTQALLNSRHVRADKPDFSVTSAAALQARFSQVTSAITLFLGAIAAVSLLVGGIGVANTMFTSVLQKTKDIGIMKAIGATNKDILLIFLFESGLLGLVGGLLGVLLGIGVSSLLYGLSLGVGGGPGGGTIKTAVSISLLVEALLFAIIIGMISGAIPAYRASKLKPVDALRYE